MPILMITNEGHTYRCAVCGLSWSRLESAEECENVHIVMPLGRDISRRPVKKAESTMFDVDFS